MVICCTSSKFTWWFTCWSLASYRWEPQKTRPLCRNCHIGVTKTKGFCVRLVYSITTAIGWLPELGFQKWSQQTPDFHIWNIFSPLAGYFVEELNFLASCSIYVWGLFIHIFVGESFQKWHRPGFARKIVLAQWFRSFQLALELSLQISILASWARPPKIVGANIRFSRL